MEITHYFIAMTAVIILLSALGYWMDGEDDGDE